VAVAAVAAAEEVAVAAAVEPQAQHR